MRDTTIYALAGFADIIVCSKQEEIPEINECAVIGSTLAQPPRIQLCDIFLCIDKENQYRIQLVFVP